MTPEPTSALQQVVWQITNSFDYMGAKVAWLDGGREAWILQGDTIMKINVDGNTVDITVNVMLGDWIRVPHITMPPVKLADVDLPSEKVIAARRSGKGDGYYRVYTRGHLTSEDIRAIRTWARAQGLPVPTGIPSITPELVEAYDAYMAVANKP